MSNENGVLEKTELDGKVNQGEPENVVPTAGQAKVVRSPDELLNDGVISQEEYDGLVKKRLHHERQMSDREKSILLKQNEILEEENKKIKEANTPKEPEIVKPKRPKKQEYFDAGKTEEQYEADVEKHEEDLLAYHAKLTDLAVSKAVNVVKESLVKKEEPVVSPEIKILQDGITELRAEHGDEVQKVIANNFQYVAQNISEPVKLAIAESPVVAQLIYDSEFIESIEHLKWRDALIKIDEKTKEILEMKKSGNASIDNNENIPEKKEEKKRPTVISPVKAKGSGGSNNPKTGADWAAQRRAEERAKAGR